MEHIKINKLEGSSETINKIGKAFHLTFELPGSKKCAYVHYFVSHEIGGVDSDKNQQLFLKIEDREAREAIILEDSSDEELSLDEKKPIILGEALEAKDDYTRLRKAMAEGTEEEFLTDFILKNHKA